MTQLISLRPEIFRGLSSCSLGSVKDAHSGKREEVGTHKFNRLVSPCVNAVGSLFVSLSPRARFGFGISDNPARRKRLVRLSDYFVSAFVSVFTRALEGNRLW